MKLWTILQIGGYVLGWFERAARDGKITGAELVELATGAAQLAGLDLKIDVPPSPPILN